MAPPPQPPQLPFPASVIDPALDSPQVPTTDQRLELLEREIEQLKSQKRSTSSPDAGLPKRRRKNPKPSAHILKKAKGLSTKQMEVRTSLMKKVKSELKNLTGRANDDDSASDSDDSDAPNISPTLPFAFAANVDDPVNVKVIDRAVHLVWTEQHDPRAETFSLPHRDIKFTREDLAEFAKTIFRGWKRTWTAETDPALAKKKAETESKGRQEMRRKELKSNRLKAIPEYKKKYKVDPVCVLESDWMSDTISAPDTDDEEKKTAHRRRLVQAARLNPSQQDDPAWERLRPAFQSTELSDIKDELDTIRAAAKNKLKKRPRPSVPRVDLGHTHDRLPTGTVWPFMVPQDWYDANIDGHEDLEDEMRMYETDPVGFGTNL
ncbi:hypothetical protein B0H17DRAFT_336875 [Mycena rosella]|uniref:Uncharacterized protein n=1 Tax=Mycena rosella TaxID=1033263 RepID=A0AAD7G2P0_MYCRO|nr:hypothetical protein B0H17DRAFT_336875 [Mycena rosella]